MSRTATKAVREYHVLNLGAGVQSTAVYMLAVEGKLRIDHAVFADTQDEPGAVYDHLDWLKTLRGPPILVRTRGKLSDNLIDGVNANGGRFVSIPAFTAEDHETRPRFCAGVRAGMMRRQCTKEYKIEVCEKAIRQEIVGLKPRQRMPKDVRVIQYYGISKDEAARADRIRENHTKRTKWSTPAFPLLGLGWTRIDCVLYLKGKVPHRVPKSSCVFCPYRSNESWAWMKEYDLESWGRAVEVDAALRAEGNRCNEGMNQKMYLHRSCVPLPVVDLSSPRAVGSEGLSLECEGGCGL